MYIFEIEFEYWILYLYGLEKLNKKLKAETLFLKLFLKNFNVY